MRRGIKYILLIISVVIFLIFNYRNIPLMFPLLLGSLALPYVSRSSVSKGNLRYALLAGMIGFLLLFVRSNSLYYFLAAFTLLFIIETYWGRLNQLPFVLALVVSPIVSNVVYIWSFPIRLTLSKWAAGTLQLVGLDIQANGNMILFAGNNFAVDPACVGLNMVVTTLVLGLVILANFEKQFNRTSKLQEVIPFIILLLLGAVLANFIRILTLILFHILPEHPLHDIIGLASMICYTLVPFYFITKYFFQKKANLPSSELSTTTSVSTPFPKLRNQIILLALFILQIISGLQFLRTPIEDVQAVQEVAINGFEKTITERGVLKLQNEEALIYIKPPVQFFQGSHDPRFCWQGSGYHFSEVTLKRLANKDVYLATLKKDKDMLYTAWWYKNSTSETPFEWTWRWETLRGADGFYLINITTMDQSTLIRLIRDEFQVPILNAIID